MKRLKALLASALLTAALLVGFQSPAHADPTVDVAVSITATPTTVTIPSSVDYVVRIETLSCSGCSVADYITLTITFPASLASLSGPCNIVNHVATCTYNTGLATGNYYDYGFTGQVTLLSIGQFTTTAALSNIQPTDSDASNDTASATCTATTTVLVTCP